MRELIELWEKVLGTPPSEKQFVIWSESHAPDVIRHGILKASVKNQQMGGTMSLDHAIRFASKCMLTLGASREETTRQHALIREEFKANQGEESCPTNK
jgi:hypothetical protein